MSVTIFYENSGTLYVQCGILTVNVSCTSLRSAVTIDRLQKLINDVEQFMLSLFMTSSPKCIYIRKMENVLLGAPNYPGTG